MGFVKYNNRPFRNKKNFYLIKTYSYYRKDFWGYIRWKRLYTYKRIIYNIMRRKRKFYHMILYTLYNGIKFFFKNYNYKTFLFFVKKQIRFFYNFLSEKTIGKLGTLVRRKNGELINFFYSLLERRIDILLIRALYVNTMRQSREFIFTKSIYLNNIKITKPSIIVLISDYIKILNYPKNNFFFQYYYPSYEKDFELLHYYHNKIFDMYQQIFLRIRKNTYFFNNFFKILLAVDLNFKFNYDLRYIIAILLKSKDRKRINRLLTRLKSTSFLYEKKSILRNYKYKFFRVLDLNLIRTLSLRLYKIVLLFIEFQIYLQAYAYYKCQIFSYKKLKSFMYAYVYRRYKYIEILRQNKEETKNSTNFEYAYRFLFFPFGYKKKKKKRFIFINYLKKMRVKKDFMKNLHLLRFAMSTLYYMGHYLKKFYLFNKTREYIKLSGLVNLRLRVKFLHKLLLPKFRKNKQFGLLSFLTKIKFKKDRTFRIWNFSYNVYLYFKYLKDIIFIYKGYPGYLEINYKIHIIVLLKLPHINEITYPFTVDKWIFYDYFRRKGYF